MAVRPILKYENARLRKKSITVKRIDSAIQTLINDMIDTMRDASGIGLAAPQVGVLLRVIVAEYIDDETEEVHQQILVNPEITSKEGEWLAEEGCLSIPGYVGTVPRAERVAVRGKDRNGKVVRLKTDGTMAHILQHEIDHLDGVLYIDYLDSLEELRPVEPGERRRRRRGAAEAEEDSQEETGPRTEPGVAGVDADSTSAGTIPENLKPAPAAEGGVARTSASSGLSVRFFDPCCDECALPTPNSSFVTRHS